MVSQLIPDIGSKGKFSFKDPVASKINASTIFTCESIRTISELISQNEDVYKKYYQIYGIVKEDYEKDLKFNVSVVSLKSEIGSWFYIPASHISSYPNMNGVSYTRMMIGVSIGAVPDTLSLDGLGISISNLVYDQLGIVPEIKNIAVSQSAMVSYTDHEKIEVVRKAKITLTKSDSLRLAEVTRERDITQAKLKELEKFIKDNIHKLK